MQEADSHDTRSVTSRGRALPPPARHQQARNHKEGSVDDEHIRCTHLMPSFARVMAWEKEDRLCSSKNVCLLQLEARC